MTSLWLIRHGSHDWLGKALVGRKHGIHLNSRGRMEADMIAHYLAQASLAALYSSPMERTVETAQPIAQICGLRIQIELSLTEIDFGAWTGLSFTELSSDPMWKKWNTKRSEASTPGGETMKTVQARMIETCDRLARRHSGEQIALVSHGDAIRSVLAYVLDLSLDTLHTLELDPGAVALVEWEGDCVTCSESTPITNSRKRPRCAREAQTPQTPIHHEDTKQ